MCPLPELGQLISGPFSVFSDNMPIVGADQMRNTNELSLEAGEDGQKLSSLNGVANTTIYFATVCIKLFMIHVIVLKIVREI